MKLNSNETQDTVSRGAQATELTISDSKMNKIKYLLSEGIYKNPKRAIVQELTSNMLDAYIEGGLDIMDNPAKILISEDDISFIDHGKGMSKEIVDTVYGKMLESTKEDSDDLLGAFGIGSKSPWAYTNQFILTTICDGVKLTYLLNKENITNTIFLLGEEETEEPNGTTVSFRIKKGDEKAWVDTILDTVQYFKGVFVVYNGEHYQHKNQIHQFNTSPIIEGNYFIYRPNGNPKYDNIEVCLKEVVYNINVRDIYPSGNLFIPVAFKLNIGEGVIPTLSRESLILNEDAKEIIRARIKEAANELKQYLVQPKNLIERLRDRPSIFFKLPYKEDSFTFKVRDVDEFRLLLDDYDFFSLPQHYVELGIADINLRYKIDDIFAVRNISTNRRRGGYRYYSLLNINQDRVLYIPDISKVNWQYLKEFYPNHLFIYDATFNLKSLKENFLSKAPKEKWRYYLDLLNKDRLDYIKDLDTYSYKDVEEWKEERRQEAALNRQGKIKVRKSKEEVSYKDYKNRLRVNLETSIDKVEYFSNFPLVIYHNDEKEELDVFHDNLLNYIRLKRKKKNDIYYSKVKFICINESNLKKIKHLKNVISFEDFLKSKFIKNLYTDKVISELYSEFLYSKGSDYQYLIPKMLHKELVDNQIYMPYSAEGSLLGLFQIAFKVYPGITYNVDKVNYIEDLLKRVEVYYNRYEYIIKKYEKYDIRSKSEFRLALKLEFLQHKLNILTKNK